MGPGWMAVALVGAFIVVLAILNIIEKGSID
jgi:hypothetical protein